MNLLEKCKRLIKDKQQSIDNQLKTLNKINQAYTKNYNKMLDDISDLNRLENLNITKIKLSDLIERLAELDLESKKISFSICCWTKNANFSSFNCFHASQFLFNINLVNHKINGVTDLNFNSSIDFSVVVKNNYKLWQFLKNNSFKKSATKDVYYLQIPNDLAKDVVVNFPVSALENPILEKALCLLTKDETFKQSFLTY